LQPFFGKPHLPLCKEKGISKMMMKRMKTLKVLMLTIGVLSSSLLFSSCLDDDGYSLGDYWLGVATIESLDSSEHFFRLDDGTSLWPAAGSYVGHNLNDGQRTWLNYTILSDSLNGFSHFVKVNGVDPILTKKMAEDLGEKNDSVYGTDPVKIRDLWIGDGYLNVMFMFNYGGSERHLVNLLPIGDEKNAYQVEFRHNAYKDPPQAAVPGIVCFDLSGLPDTEGETVKLTVKVSTFNGERTYELEYNSNTKLMTDRDPANFDIKDFERVN